MMKGANQERKQYWRDLIERQPTSGLSITRFCAQAGVSENSFYVWKRRLRAMAVKKRPGPRAFRARKAKAKSSALVPVRLIPDLDLASSPAQPIEVVWPGGLVLRIPTPCDAPTLREVFHLLAATSSSQSPPC
jgi:hypothetical protein